MSTETPAPQAAPPRRIGPITIPSNFGPLMFLLITAIGISAVFWGRFGADPGIEVVLFDAGPEEAIISTLRDGGGEIVAFPEQHVYISGLEDGRLRVVDGRVEFSGCNVEYLPGDARGRARNPNRTSGVLEDPCSGAVWSVAGDAIAGVNEPLRTPRFTFDEDDDGVRHLFVEVISVSDD